MQAGSNSPVTGDRYVHAADCDILKYFLVHFGFTNRTAGQYYPELKFQI
jgi:hypothetical protein